MKTHHPYSKVDESRFWSKVNRNGQTPDQTNPHYAGLSACWEWIAGKFTSGYGQAFMGKTHCRAHRVSYQLVKGEIPEGAFVIHKCDNRACVNPDHLIAASHADNVADRDAKGRNRPPSGDDHYSRRRPDLVKRGEDHPSKKHPEMIKRGKDHYNFGNPKGRGRGEQNPAAKLKKETVITIRKEWSAGGKTQRKIAQEMGVDYRHVNAIINHRVWKTAAE